jgi:membrane protein YqaA with SNARE-associated domain
VKSLEELAAFAAPKGKQQAAFHWIIRLGAPGLFAVSFIDATVIPLVIPGSTDLLLLWLISHGGSPWLMVPCALAGSLTGAWTTWRLGKKGGQAAIRRYVSPRLQKRVLEWSKHRPVLVVFVPAILPPPIPLWPFLLAAGALGVTWRRFLAAFGAGRLLRYGLEGWLAVIYGRPILRFWSVTLDKWGPAVLWAFIALSAAGVAWGAWKLRRGSRQEHRDRSLRPSHAK